MAERRKCDCGEDAKYRSKITNRVYCQSCVDSMMGKALYLSKDKFELMGTFSKKVPSKTFEDGVSI